jgi:hypothetical protein
LASGRATQENALRYMKAMMDMYQNAYRALPAPMNPFELLQGRWAQRPVANGATTDPQARGGQPQPASGSQTKAGEVNELKRRIEELELLLTKLVPKKSKPIPKSRRKP